MRYLKKHPDSIILRDDITYRNNRNNDRLRTALTEEQSGYCAYTEEWMTPLHSVDVEHFDGRLKNTTEDNYWNWYAVLHKPNMKKPRNIENYLPILPPHTDDIRSHIKYEDGQYRPVVENDEEAINLINYLGFNSPMTADTRNRFIRHQRYIFHNLLDGDMELFIQYLRYDPAHLSFRTALEAEFGQIL